MSKRYKGFEYEITTDPKFMDKQNAMTPALRNELEPLYIEVMEGNGSKKTIAKIMKLIEEYPRNPQLKNYLSVAYNVNGNTKKARETNKWIISEHPDYLFGKLNQAAEYYENEEYEKMPELMGKMMDIQDVYPQRKTFHLTEVTAFLRFAIMYFTAIGNQEAAEARYEIMETIAPGFPDTEQALPYLIRGRLSSGMNKWEEEEKAGMRVVTSEGIHVKQTTERPDFTHDEVNLIYEMGLDMGKENLDKILSLPRPTLISDLEKVLQDLPSRYDYFNELCETDGWSDETMTFPVHAMYLLGELKSEESLDTILSIFRHSPEVLDFWFNEFLTGDLWEPLYYISNNQTDKLKAFVCEPAIYTMVRSEIGIMVKQIAYHQPERRVEVIDWFRDVLQFYINCDIDSNVVDFDAIAFMIGELVNIRAVELIPEIEKLHELDYVNTFVNGDLAHVISAISEPLNDVHKIELKSISDRYTEIITTWDGYLDDDEFDDDEFDDDEFDDDEFDDEIEFVDDYEDEIDNESSLSDKQNNENKYYYSSDQPLIKEKEPGRNDPCSCGSGKKYKKCCMNKSDHLRVV